MAGVGCVAPCGGLSRQRRGRGQVEQALMSPARSDACHVRVFAPIRIQSSGLPSLDDDAMCPGVSTLVPSFRVA